MPAAPAGPTVATVTVTQHAAAAQAGHPGEHRRAPARVPVGLLLREWRQRRRLSQLELGLAAGVSARHLSFVETGRSRPSREMVLHLCEHLDVPLRQRNRMLLAAGYAPVFGERPLDHGEMGPLRDTLARLLAAYEPYPALVVDLQWNLVLANRGVGLLTGLVAPALLEPPVNVLRVSLHPDGLAPRIVNLRQWRGHILERLGRQVVLTGDPGLAALRQELAGYPVAAGPDDVDPGLDAFVALPVRIRTDDAELAFLTTVTTFGTAVDATASELVVEAFFPADAATARALRPSP